MLGAFNTAGRFSTDDRATMMFAAQEAADLGHSRVGADHIILGMLGNARSPLFTLLSDQGLTLAATRDAVRAFHADRAADGDAEVDGDDDSDRRYDEDRDALRGLGIDLDRLRDAVRGRFGDDLAEGWGRRRDRRGRGEGRGRGGGERDCDRGRGRGPRGEWRGRGDDRGGDYGPGGFGPGGFGPGGFGRGERGHEHRGDWRREDWREGWDDHGPWESGRGRRGPRGRGMRPRFAPELREAFGNAVTFARNSDDKVRAEHLLIGILDLESSAVTAALGRAVEPAELRDVVVASLAEADAPAS